MHTHADERSKVDLLTPLLGTKSIDGLSFQVADRKTISQQLSTWFARSKQAGHPWLITMDEVGEWHTGCRTDAEDPNHDTIRRFALWGSLMRGAAGVEWYFGAKSKHNDLTSEDWRQRDRLWELTRIATRLFENHLPWYEMKPADELIKVATPSLADGTSHYCLASHGKTYACYFHRAKIAKIDLKNYGKNFDVRWYDPLVGGDLLTGSVSTVSGPGIVEIGFPPIANSNADSHDWVVLLTASENE